MKTVYVDLETGGLEMHHPVIQIAAVAVDGDWNELGAFQVKLFFDESKAEPEALRINRYDRSIWEHEAFSERCLS